MITLYIINTIIDCLASPRTEFVITCHYNEIDIMP